MAIDVLPPPIDTSAFVGAGTEVATSETTTSTAYADLATVGPSVTIMVPAAGNVLCQLHAELQNGGGNYNFMGVALSGANTVAAADAQSIGMAPPTTQWIGGGFVLFSGLTPGLTTFTAKYRTTAGTLTASSRRIYVRSL